MASSSHSKEESDDRSSLSTLQQMLQICQAHRRQLQERLSAFEGDLSHKKKARENQKIEARTFDNGLKKCIEDKAEVEAKCAKLDEEMIRLHELLEKTAASKVADESMALRHVKLENQLGQTEVSRSTEELNNCNEDKEMIALLASIRLENLTEDTGKLAAEFASFKTDLERMINQFQKS